MRLLLQILWIIVAVILTWLYIWLVWLVWGKMSYPHLALIWWLTFWVIFPFIKSIPLNSEWQYRTYVWFSFLYVIVSGLFCWIFFLAWKTLYLFWFLALWFFTIMLILFILSSILWKSHYNISIKEILNIKYWE